MESTKLANFRVQGFLLQLDYRYIDFYHIVYDISRIK